MYTSPNYSPDQVKKKTITCDPYGNFKLFELNDKGQTIRESIPNLASIPAAKVKEARALRGQAFNQVFL